MLCRTLVFIMATHPQSHTEQIAVCADIVFEVTETCILLFLPGTY